MTLCESVVPQETEKEVEIVGLRSAGGNASPGAGPLNTFIPCLTLYLFLNGSDHPSQLKGVFILLLKLCEMERQGGG